MVDIKTFKNIMTDLFQKDIESLQTCETREEVTDWRRKHIEELQNYVVAGETLSA
jgi:hypothetical protein